MITVRDIIWMIIIFLAILILLMLLRPLFILKRDPLTGRPIEIINGWKLLGWTILFTFIAVLAIFLFQRCNCHYSHSGDLVL